MSTEVIDPPVTQPEKTATPPGRISFKDAMAKAEAEANPEPAAPKPAAEAKPAAAAPEPKKQPEQAPEKKPAKEAPKPTNAIDALLSGAPAAEPKKDAEPEDPLKEFPANAKDKDRNYAGLRKKAEDGWARARELEAKISTPDPKLTGELESARKTLAERETALKEMEAKMAEYKDAMTAVNIELDPDYRREFIDGRKARVAAAGAKLKTYGGDENALAEALAMPEGLRRDEMLDTLTQGLSETARAKVLRAVAEVEVLDEKRAALLSSPQASFEELQRRHAEQSQMAAEQSEAVKKATFDKVAKELAASVPTLGFADETLEGGKDWNAGRAANNQSALALLGNDTPPEQIVAASIKASDYDRVSGLYLGARKIIAEQAARLAEYEGAQPTTTGHRKPVPTKEEQLAKLTPGERFTHAMGSQDNRDF